MNQDLSFFNDTNLPHISRIELVARQIYGADAVEFSSTALDKLKNINSDSEFSDFSICIAKTHLSLSDNPALRGVPEGWQLFIRDILIFKGAKLIVPVAGEIKSDARNCLNSKFQKK